MSTDVSQLPDDPQQLKELIAEMGGTIAAQQQKLDQFQHYIQRLLQARYGPRAERIDPDQLALFKGDESAETTQESPEEEPPETVVRGHRRRGGGRQKLPENLPREQVAHDLTDSEKPCPCCGGMRKRIGSETSEQLEFIPASLKVIEHVRPSQTACACGRLVGTSSTSHTVTTADNKPPVAASTPAGIAKNRLPRLRFRPSRSRKAYRQPDCWPNWPSASTAIISRCTVWKIFSPGTESRFPAACSAAGWLAPPNCWSRFTN